MNIAPVSIARTNSNIFRKNEQPPVSTPVKTEFSPSFQAKKVQLLQKTGKWMRTIVATGLAAVATIIPQINNQPKFATVEEFAKYGLNVTEVDKESGLYTIEKLNYNDETDSYENKEFIEKHFHQIKKIEGDVRFDKLDITSLENLEEIGGNADFGGSKVTSLGNLKVIGGNANFNFLRLEEIGEDANFRDSQTISSGDIEFSKIRSLCKLKEIGEDVNFIFVRLEEIEKEIEKEKADFPISNIRSLGKLKEIGGDDRLLTSLGKVERIGGNADFRNSEITSLGNLKEIGGTALYKNHSRLSEADFENIKIGNMCG